MPPLIIQQESSKIFTGKHFGEIRAPSDKDSFRSRDFFVFNFKFNVEVIAIQKEVLLMMGKLESFNILFFNQVQILKFSN